MFVIRFFYRHCHWDIIYYPGKKINGKSTKFIGREDKKAGNFFFS